LATSKFKGKGVSYTVNVGTKYSVRDLLCDVINSA